MPYNKARGDFVRYRRLFIILCIMSLCCICTGCGDFHDAIFEEENINIPEEYDADNFFVKEVEQFDCSAYILCYEHRGGEVTEIADMGFEQHNFVIVEDRIYYVNGSTLTCIDFAGQDRRTFHDAECEVEPREVMYYADGWLYCHGTKWVEIYGDPVALDGPHPVTGFMKVRIDFSGCEEVDGAEVEDNVR